MRACIEGFVPESIEELLSLPLSTCCEDDDFYYMHYAVPEHNQPAEWRSFSVVDKKNGDVSEIYYLLSYTCFHSMFGDITKKVPLIPEEEMKERLRALKRTLDESDHRNSRFINESEFLDFYRTTKHRAH